MVKLTEAEAWITCALGALLVCAALGWLAGWKYSPLGLPIAALCFLFAAGDSVLRGRPLGAEALIYFDAAFTFSVILVLLKRTTKSSEYVLAAPEEKSEVLRQHVRSITLISMGAGLALLFVELIA